MWSSGACNKHSNEKQLPGVCSSCLREKLSQLELQSDHRPICCDSSPVSDTPKSSESPPPAAGYGGRNHRRNASEVVDSAASMRSLEYGLKKSRSMAFASRNGMSGSWRKKKKGFWSKILKLTKKGTDKSMY